MSEVLRSWSTGIQLCVAKDCETTEYKVLIGRYRTISYRIVKEGHFAPSIELNINLHYSKQQYRRKRVGLFV